MSMIGRMIVQNFEAKFIEIEEVESKFDENKWKERVEADLKDQVPFPEVERNIIFDNINNLTAIRQEENNRLVGNVLEKIGISIEDYLKFNRR